jgi:hypothetical protein
MFIPKFGREINVDCEGDETHYITTTANKQLNRSYFAEIKTIDSMFPKYHINHSIFNANDFMMLRSIFIQRECHLYERNFIQ